MAQSNQSSAMPVIHQNAAGIDIGSQFHVVAVPPDRTDKPVRTFKSFKGELHAMAKWLKKCRVDTIAMESTGVYWIPAFEILESYGFEVFLVNARAAKTVPGRKTDVNDAQWLQKLHQFGLLQASFQPSQKIAGLRAYLRQREKLLEYKAAHIQHMQKAMMQMNIQLQHVVTDVTGKTGLAIIRAIVQGQNDPNELVKLRDPHCKNSLEVMTAALTGSYKPEHLFALTQALELIDFYVEKIEACDRVIESTLKQLQQENDSTPPPTLQKARGRESSKNNPSFDVRQSLFSFIGIDLTQIHGIGSSVALKLVAECGTDMTKWPTSKHFTSWLCLAPCNKISGGKILSSRTRRSSSKVATMLRLAAVVVGKTSTALGAAYRRYAARIGKAKAVTVIARKLAILFYNALRYGMAYVDKGANYYEEQYQKKVINNLHRKADALGYTLQKKALSISAAGVS